MCVSDIYIIVLITVFVGISWVRRILYVGLATETSQDARRETDVGKVKGSRLVTGLKTKSIICI